VVCKQTPATRQGSQFTLVEFITVLASWKIKISMPLSDFKHSLAGKRRKSRLARQRLRQAPVADDQIQGGLTARLRQRL
jgi:hypothetical protein